MNNLDETWYEPSPDDHIAYITRQRIIEIGNNPSGDFLLMGIAYRQGFSILSRWCRVNCKDPGKPVNVRGETGWAFNNKDDALLFKLTWG
jgi:hypothetical protein